MGVLCSAIYWVGPVLGMTAGLLGGGIGTWMTIRRAAGPRQRKEAIRFSVLIWALVAALLVGLALLSGPWRHVLWLPYGLILPAVILWGNQRFQAARRADDGS